MESAVSADNPPSSVIVQNPTDIVETLTVRDEELTVHDVLCGRGVTTNKWAGNEQFRSLVGANKELYVTSTKRQKMAISRSIVDAVRSMNPPGRFLEKNVDTGLWQDIGNRKAIEKTSQALRDGAATLRKQLSADLGDPEFLSAVFDMESSAATAKAASHASLSAKEKEKEKISVIKAKTNQIKKGLRRAMSSPDVASSLKETSMLKRALQKMDAPNSPAVRGVHSNPTSPREGRIPTYRTGGGPYPSQFPPLQVEFSGPRGFFECVSDYPICGSNYRTHDPGYEPFDSRPPYSPTVPSYPPPGAPPMSFPNQQHPPAIPRAYPPPPHPSHSRNNPYSPPSSGNYEHYWRPHHPSMPSSPVGSVRSGGTVRSSPAALLEYERRTVHHRHPCPPQPSYQPPPPYYHHHHRHSHPYARHPKEGSVSPMSHPTSPASPGDFTPPMSPHADRVPKREETVLTARHPEKTTASSSKHTKSPDDVASSFPADQEEVEESFGFEVVLRERDEAATDSTPLRDAFQPGHLYYSYTRDDDKDDPAQISHEEDHSASPFHYEHDDDMDDHVSTSFMMDISDDLLLEPIAPVGPMD